MQFVWSRNAIVWTRNAIDWASSGSWCLL